MPGRSDNFVNAVKLLVALGGFAAKPGLLSGLKSGLSIHDTLKQMAAKAPPGIATLADTLADDARALFDGFARDLPPDASLLYEQMVIAGLPDPRDIVAANMDAAQIAAAMRARHQDREHLRPPMPDLFDTLTIPALDRLLADKDFANDLTPAFMAEVLSDLERNREILQSLETQYGSLARALDALTNASRDQLEAIAGRFEIERAFDLSDPELRTLLDNKAEEYRAYRAQIEAIDERTAGLGNLKAAAQDAADRLDFEEVEVLLSRVHEVELSIAAETSELRARNALMRGRVDQAFTLLSAAADSFAVVDPMEPARRRALLYAPMLADHGRRYGDAGLALAQRMLESILTDDLYDADSYAWGATQNMLATCLEERGARRGGPDGIVLLSQAIDGYQAALEVGTRDTHPEEWALTKNNLGNALLRRVSHIGLADGLIDLAAAVDAYNEALEVLTKDTHPAEWAMVQVNLGNASKDLGFAAIGDEAADMLEFARDAYASALEVYTPEQHPQEWATTLLNLGDVVRGIALTMEESAEAAEALVDARALTEGALAFFTRETHPVQWAIAQENLALLEEAVADHDTTADPAPHLEAALAHIEAALTVYDPDRLSALYERATAQCDHLHARLDGDG